VNYALKNNMLWGKRVLYLKYLYFWEVGRKWGGEMERRGKKKITL
jgi:hypothetical protein